MEGVTRDLMRTSVDSESDHLMPDETVPTLYCAYHPGRETVLRCNRCDKPICYECAVRTPVGYRCKDCVRQQQAVYFNANPLDPLIAAVVALILGAVAGVVAIIVSGILGFIGLLVAFFAGPVAGGLIAEHEHPALIDVEVDGRGGTHDQLAGAYRSCSRHGQLSGALPAEL